MKGFMLAGASSNVGKTTVTFGIMRELKRRNLRVVPYKTGPDYVDPMFHSIVTGEKSTNLDTYLLDEETIKFLFENKLTDESVAVIEGVMGVYDGISGDRSLKGSSAYLSKILKLPVFLIIDARGMMTSAAAMVKGYVDFDKDTNFKGIIINKIKNKSHFEMLKKEIEHYVNIPVVGYFPLTENLEIKNRHLGLTPAKEQEDFQNKIEIAADLAKNYLDLDKILELSEIKISKDLKDPFDRYKNKFQKMKIAYAKDECFCFYYEDNLSALRKMGVELIPFNALEDKKLPDCDALYIGGGYTEIFAKKLSKNSELLEDLRKKAEQGLYIYAESEGLIYLSKGFKNSDGKFYKMAGIFDFETENTDKLQNFGYNEITADLSCEKINTKAHEFHYSKIAGENIPENIFTVRKKTKNWEGGFRTKNVLAEFSHIHFYSNPKFIVKLLEIIKEEN